MFKQLLGLIVFSDASWKNNSSYAGFFIMLSGAAVDWGAILLKVMCSSAEAEIASGSLASKRVIEEQVARRHKPRRRNRRHPKSPFGKSKKRNEPNQGKNYATNN